MTSGGGTAMTWRLIVLPRTIQYDVTERQYQKPVLGKMARNHHEGAAHL